MHALIQTETQISASGAGGAFPLNSLLSIPFAPTPTTSPGARTPAASHMHTLMMADPASTDTATEKLCANCSCAQTAACAHADELRTFKNPNAFACETMLYRVRSPMIHESPLR